MSAETRRFGTILGTTFIALLLIILIASSDLRRIGDGSGYLAMTEQLARWRAPSLTNRDLREEQARQRRIGSGYQGARLARRLLRAGGRQDFDHFWMYSLLAVPFYDLTRLLGIHPGWSFVAVNLLLYLLAVAVSARRIHWAALLLLFVGPGIWWIDKAHTEAFTFSLLAIAFVLARQKPWWALVALGLAATQNPPIVFAIPLVAGVAILGDRSLIRRRAFLIGGAAAVGIAALHPLYYQLRLGVLTPTSASGVTHYQLPDARIVFGWIIDPNIGLLVGFPLLIPTVLVVLVAMLLRAPRALTPWTWAVAPAVAAFFLVAFSQTVNFNSAATPLLARYSVWLIPLAIPLFVDATALPTRTFTMLIGPLAVTSAVWMVMIYAPSRPEDTFITPTFVARWLWDRHPGIDNPPAELFFERTAHYEGPPVSIATASCSKVLIIDGMWPKQCGPKPLFPGWCARTGDHCFANRTGSGFELVPTPT